MGQDRHHHTEQTIHVLVQRRGIPYELELVVCRLCRAVLAERPLRRAAA
jgi:hypothetical protein